MHLYLNIYNKHAARRSVLIHCEVQQRRMTLINKNTNKNKHTNMTYINIEMQHTHMQRTKKLKLANKYSAQAPRQYCRYVSNCTLGQAHKHWAQSK